MVNVIDVPIITLRVFGIAADCNIGVIQSNWVYNSAPAPAGVQQLYKVFDNGKNYTARLQKNGFYTIDSAPANRVVYEGAEELRIYFNNFYQIVIPEGVTNLRMKSNNWIVDYMTGPVGAKLALLVDYNNIRSANMTFNFAGKSFNIDFLLDGSNPFNVIVEINKVIPPTCSLEGYTITHEKISTGEQWYADYVPALGHVHGAPVWDDGSWYIVCDVCGWAGYISYDPDMYGDDGDDTNDGDGDSEAIDDNDEQDEDGNGDSDEQ
jgi:hypothetical protein